MTESLNKVQFIYYNLMISLFYRNAMELSKIEYYMTPFRNQERNFRLREFSAWCRAHHMKYTYKFIRRKDFPLTANLWNAYTVLHWRIGELRWR